MTPTILGLEHGRKSIVGTKMRTIRMPPIADTFNAENEITQSGQHAIIKYYLHLETVHWYFPVPYKPIKAPVNPPMIITAKI